MTAGTAPRPAIARRVAEEGGAQRGGMLRYAHDSARKEWDEGVKGPWVETNPRCQRGEDPRSKAG